MSDFQRWEQNWDSFWIGLGGGCRGNLCSCSAPDSRLCTWMSTLLLGSFFWGMKQINCKRIPGNSLCALSLQSFFLRLHGKKKFRSLKCLMQNFQNRQGRPAFLSCCSTVKLHTDLLPATWFLTKDVKHITIIFLKYNCSFEDKKFNACLFNLCSLTKTEARCFF